MITLYVNKGEAFVWNADDWLDLREHRIVGNLVGCIPSLPRQDLLHGLPLVLLPEEATLLLEKKLAKLVSYADVTEEIINEAKIKFNEYKQKVRQEQVSYYEEERKKQVVAMIDRIIEGKRRKLSNTKGKKEDESSTDKDLEIDRETILKNELEKAGNIPETSTLVQTFRRDVWNGDAVKHDVPWPFPRSEEERQRFLTFKDLWERGYHITAGQKFGGDFLVYPGDPIKFHAQFIIVCVGKNCELTASDVVTYGRLGSSTRKTLVLASLSEDSTVRYQSLLWAEMN